MTEAQCPFCGCKTFYIKDPEDAFETYEFTSAEGRVSFCEPADKYPSVLQDTETYCNQCAWHGKFGELSR